MLSTKVVGLLSLVCLPLLLAGCGTPVETVQAPVPVTINVTVNGKPIHDVQLTLQPMVDGAQAVGTVAKGEFKAEVVPGIYTYYIDSGKSAADLAKIPDAYRMGSKDRKLELTQAGTFDVSIN